MVDFLYYQSVKLIQANALPAHMHAMQTLYSDANRILKYSSEPGNTYVHLKHEIYECFILGNINFMRDFKMDALRLFDSKGICLKEWQSVFRNINGTYCALIINNQTGVTTLITDPLGFYPVYYYQDPTVLIWSSEIKHVTALDFCKRTIREAAVDSYLHNGQLILDQSWFKEIQRARPASYYEWTSASSQLTRHYYWTWENVRKIDDSKDRILGNYIELFHSGIANLNLSNNMNTGISLSGGLDSRWIASTASKSFPVETFTFSMEGDTESKIASRVAEGLNIPNHRFELLKSNWLLPRLKSFWKTDALLPLQHQHEAPIHFQLKNQFPRYFHGFFGGGIYSGSPKGNHRITELDAGRLFQLNGLDPCTEDVFYNGTVHDSWIIDQKIRMLSAHSIYLLSSNCKILMPFYNMDWMEYNYSIDDHWQSHSRFYLEALNRDLPARLLQLPWQKTGLSPKYIRWNVFLQSIKWPAIHRSFLNSCRHSRHFINYAAFDQELNQWIKYFQNDIRHLGMDYPLNSRERKQRMLSLVIALRMWSKNHWDVL